MFLNKTNRQLLAERSRRDVQQECDHAAEAGLRAREEVILCVQTTAKAKAIVDPIVVRSMEVVEPSERLRETVRHLLQCSRGVGEEVYTAVRQVVLDFHIPLDAATAES